VKLRPIGCSVVIGVEELAVAEIGVVGTNPGLSGIWSNAFTAFVT
jgi:hypothetical protein